MPDSDLTAVDSVIQYAIQKMGFVPESIGVFAWSIGGFCASWLAKTYPDLKQVVSISPTYIRMFYAIFKPIYTSHLFLPLPLYHI